MCWLTSLPFNYDMKSSTFVAVCLCLVQLSTASTSVDSKNPRIYEVAVKESVAPGYIVSNIPQVFQRTQMSAPETLNISKGNKDDRFSLSEDSGDLCVKKHLNYEIDSRYELTLTTENQQVVLIVIVSVEDDPAYPPVFNPNCYMPPRNKSIVDDWPFTVSVKSVWLSKPSMIVGGDKNDVSVMIDNDQCDVKAFAAVKDDKVDRINKDFKPSFTLSCRNTQEPTRNMPDIKTYWNASYHRPNDRGINPNWFVDSPDDPHERHVLVTLDMKNFYGLNPSIYGCTLSFDLGFFAATVSGDITIDPIGCPDGFYGGHCKETCVCQNGGSCHPFNGSCKCPNGWTGRACDIVSHRHFHHGRGSFNVGVSEGVAPGHLITSVCRLYLKWWRGDGQFRITSGNKDDRFTIGNETGDVIVKRHLNFDIDPHYDLRVTNDKAERKASLIRLAFTTELSPPVMAVATVT